MRLVDRAIASDPYANDPSETRRLNSPYRESVLRRVDAIQRIADNYNLNIARYFGNDDGFIDNDDYRRRVSQRVYMRGAIGSAK